MSIETDSEPSFRINNLKKAWQSGKPTLNGWLALPDAASAEIMAHAGWDSLTIDMQHGLIDYRDALSILRAISTTSTVPLVRVPWLDEGMIMKMLDAGAYGIICPMIDTADQAISLARACRYPPRGDRSLGPVRASLYGGPGYVSRANDQIPVFAMIETRTGINNVDEILKVDELSGLFVGPSDLSLAFGETPRLDPIGTKAEEAMIDIIKKSRAAGKFAGAFCGSVDYAIHMISNGANFVTVGSDLRFLSAKASSVVSEFRKKQK
jgi:4-hydroxy-2-oxoheptanedioate aldolase